MTFPISPGSPKPPEPTPGYGIPPEALAGIKVNPGDENLLNTPWGKWMSNMPGAPTDKEEMIKLIKASIQQYINQIRIEMQRDDQRQKETLRKLKRVAQGEDPDS